MLLCIVLLVWYIDNLFLGFTSLFGNALGTWRENFLIEISSKLLVASATKTFIIQHRRDIIRHCIETKTWLRRFLGAFMSRDVFHCLMIGRCRIRFTSNPPMWEGPGG